MSEREPRELLCEICDRDYPVWFAPSDLWNRVIRGGTKGGDEMYAFLCPTCFATLAEIAGVETTGWMLTTEQPDVSALHIERSNLLSELAAAEARAVRAEAERAELRAEVEMAADTFADFKVSLGLLRHHLAAEAAAIAESSCRAALAGQEGKPVEIEGLAEDGAPL